MYHYSIIILLYHIILHTIIYVAFQDRTYTGGYHGADSDHRLCLYICIYIYIYIYTHMCVCMYVCIYIYIYIRRERERERCMSCNICVYVYYNPYLSISLSLYVYICICLFIYAHIHTGHSILTNTTTNNLFAGPPRHLPLRQHDRAERPADAPGQHCITQHTIHYTLHHRK